MGACNEDSRELKLKLLPTIAELLLRSPQAEVFDE